MQISIVIPVYNEKKYIGPCLDNLIKQKEKADEIIIVDNNSTDGTFDIVKKYPVKIIKEDQQGITYARNRGFNAAKGDIIARSDADTIVPRDWIKQIKADFQNNSIDALGGTCVFYDSPLQTTLIVDAYIDFMKIVQNGKDTLNGFNFALTKKIWQKVKNDVCLDNSKVHEDIDLAIHIAKIGGKIMIDKSLVVKISSRRIKNNPASFFIEYPIRVIKTLALHTSSLSRLK